MSAIRDINGTTYSVKRVKPSVALPMFYELGKTLGPGFEAMFWALIDARQEKVTEEGIGMKMAGGVLAILNHADPAAAASLTHRLASLAVVHRPSGAEEPVQYDQDFEERPEDLFPVIGLVVEEVFGPLAVSALAMFKQAGAAAKLA